MPFFNAPYRLAVAAVFAAATTLGVSSTAQARNNVSISIGIHVPADAVVYPAPVYVPQRPVYVQPRPVYMQPQPVYVQPAPVFMRPRPVVVYPPAAGYYYRPAPQWHHGHWKKPKRRGHHDHGRDRD